MSTVTVVSDISTGPLGTPGNAYCIKVYYNGIVSTFCGRFKVPDWDSKTEILEAAAMTLGIRLAKQFYPGKTINAFVDHEAVLTHAKAKTVFPWLFAETGGDVHLHILPPKAKIIRSLHMDCHNSAKVRYKAKHYEPQGKGKMHKAFMNAYNHLLPENSAIWAK